jgi:hypothetical protein
MMTLFKEGVAVMHRNGCTLTTKRWRDDSPIIQRVPYGTSDLSIRGKS